MALLTEVFWPSHSERFTCCVLTIQYIICSTVGWSIASISDFSVHIYLSASVVYIGYGPPYRTTYITNNIHSHYENLCAFVYVVCVSVVC